MTGQTHKARHRGPVLTLTWTTDLQAGTRVLIGSGAVNRLADTLKQLGTGMRVLLVHQPGKHLNWIDQVREDLAKEGFTAQALEVEDGERSKDVSWLTRIWGRLAKDGFDRADTLVAIGGGAVTDLGGFAASTYMRGINLVLVPTTLLGQVDAAVGGKTGINLDEGKNLAGAFYFPRAVIVDPDTLSTLPARQFRSGLAEIIKYAYIEGTVADNTEYSPGTRPLLDVLEQSVGESFAYDDPALPAIVMSCIKMKLLVVAKDARESGLRRSLNLGHTLGHALEKVTGYELTHGEAISIGMVFAFELALRKGLIDDSASKGVRNLLQRTGLPLAMPHGLEKASLVAAMSRDKKKIGDTLKFVLPKGKPGFVDFGVDVRLSELAEAL